MTATAAPISMGKKSDDPRPLLFRPFCRGCFGGEKECPEHALGLLPVERLPKEEDDSAIPAHDRPVAPFEHRFGRGFVMVGIVLSLVGFAMPFLLVTSGGEER